MERAKSTERVDMSPDAVSARLRDLARLYALGQSLKNAKVLGPVSADGSNVAAETSEPDGSDHER